METSTRKADAKRLQMYLRVVDRSARMKLLNALVTACKVEWSTFNNWRYGYTPIPDLAKERIEQVFGKPIFSLPLPGTDEALQTILGIPEDTLKQTQEA